MAFDFDNDGKADFVIADEAGKWADLARPDASPLYLGERGDRPVPSDYDGTGYKPAILDSSDNWVTQGATGSVSHPPPDQLPQFAGHSLLYQVLPVPADYDGSGKAQPAWYRDTDGMWFIKGHDPIQFGVGPTRVTFVPGSKGNDLNDQDIAVPADYDGDGKADLATFNPRTRVWRVKSSRDGSVSSVTMPGSNGVVSFPVPGDYDGVGHAQRAVFGSDGWYIEGHDAPIPFGNVDPGSVKLLYPPITAPADYDGDGKLDLSYVSSDGVWTTRSSADPSKITTIDIGKINLGSINPNKLPVEFSTELNYLLARITLIAKNCTLDANSAGTREC